MNSFDKIYEQMRRQKMTLPKKCLQLSIPDARNQLNIALSYFLDKEDADLEWLPEYELIADWLGDNKGRGLFLFGQCGRGKSLLGRYVLPALILKHCQRVVNVLDTQELNHDIDTALSKQLLSIDDVGTEEMSVKYGERRLAFAELMDAAEKQNKLLIISSNLNANEIQERYGERTLDRIKATCERVVFRGKSFRDMNKKHEK